MDTNAKTPETIEANLGLWDAISIIVGIIIGVGIFETPPRVFAVAPNPVIAIGVWVLGGVLALLGAFCFAELASAYPRSGGEYVYLTRAFGPLTGFLFAWSQLTVTRSGSVAALAYIFGLRTASLFGFDDTSIFLLAGLSLIVLTAINILGVHIGTRTQHVLTLAKVLGLGALIVVGLGWGRPELAVPENVEPRGVSWLAGAMIFILWTYSGWHEAAYIVAETRHRTRNIPLALILGTSIVTVIYVLVNLGYLFGLGVAGASNDNAAEALLNLAWPGYGARVMDLFILISALGAMNGMIFTSARIYAEFGKDHRIFKALSHWSKRWKTPIRALFIQGIICLAMIGGVWVMGGSDKSFDNAIKLTAAVFWMFFCLTGLALILLRVQDPDTPRPFRVPGYPVVPLVFCFWCAYMVVGTVLDDAEKSLIGLGILLAGLPLYFIPKKLKERKPQPDLQPMSK
jgi:basic amino acid/polyamine antiporter, APA family